MLVGWLTLLVCTLNQADWSLISFQFDFTLGGNLSACDFMLILDKETSHTFDIQLGLAECCEPGSISTFAFKTLGEEKSERSSRCQQNIRSTRTSLK